MFPAVQVERTAFPPGTHTGAGPGVWGGVHPPIRGCPALAGGTPCLAPPQSCARGASTLRGIAQTPRAPSGPCAPERSAERSLGPPRCLPARRVRTPPPRCPEASPRTSGEGQEQGALTRTRGARARPSPDARPTASPRLPAAAATPARPAPSPPPLPTAGSRLHSGSRVRSSAGSNHHRHFPIAPRLRVRGATSAKACAPGWERRPGRSARWEL